METEQEIAVKKKSKLFNSFCAEAIIGIAFTVWIKCYRWSTVLWCLTWCFLAVTLWGVYIQNTSSSDAKGNRICDSTGSIIDTTKTLHSLFSFAFVDGLDLLAILCSTVFLSGTIFYVLIYGWLANLAYCEQHASSRFWEYMCTCVLGVTITGDDNCQLRRFYLDNHCVFSVGSEYCSVGAFILCCSWNQQL